MAGRIKKLSLSEQRKKIAFRKILRDNEMSSVNGIVYILFAFVLGAIGIHNFYAKFWKRGLIQFCLTVIAPYMLFIPLVFTSMWAEAELLFQNRDKDGRLFNGSRRKIWLLRLMSIVVLVWGLMSLETIDFDAELFITDDVLDDIIYPLYLKTVCPHSIYLIPNNRSSQILILRLCIIHKFYRSCQQLHRCSVC